MAIASSPGSLFLFWVGGGKREPGDEARMAIDELNTQYLRTVNVRLNKPTKNKNKVNWFNLYNSSHPSLAKSSTWTSSSALWGSASSVAAASATSFSFLTIAMFAGSTQ